MSTRRRSSRCPIHARSTSQGSRPDIRVPMREITQSDTPAEMGAEKNPPIFVYDTSGPYTDPAVKIDIRSGLAAAARRLDRRARRHQGTCRADFELRRRAARRSETRRTAFQSEAHAAPRQSGHECVADALRAPRHHHAGNGIHRNSREPAPRRAFRIDHAPASGARVSAPPCRKRSRRNSCATKSRAAARSFRPTSTIRKPSR